ncbi:MAG: hypothetical protein H7X86_04430, partial [Gorillibacterium sp.]|nr:hypothetical protein [Gorillibacterium sp.]
MLRIVNESKRTRYRPLESIRLSSSISGVVSVTDGNGKEYVRQAIEEELSFQTGGVLGRHTVRLFDTAGKEVAVASFQLDAETVIEGHPLYEKMLQTLYFS